MNERVELERELQKIAREIERREARVREIDQRLAKARYESEQREAVRMIRAGDAAALMQNEAYRRSVRQKIGSLERERAEAVEDVRRALERRGIVEQELAGRAGE